MHEAIALGKASLSVLGIFRGEKESLDGKEGTEKCATAVSSQSQQTVDISALTGEHSSSNMAHIKIPAGYIVFQPSLKICSTCSCRKKVIFALRNSFADKINFKG